MPGLLGDLGIHRTRTGDPHPWPISHVSEGGNTSVQIFPGSAVEDIGWVTEQSTQVEAPQGRRVKIVSAWAEEEDTRHARRRSTKMNV